MTAVLVASGGGHLTQLDQLVPRLGLDDDVVWVTPRSGLSVDLLRDRDAIEIPYSPPRDWVAACRLAPAAMRILVDVKANRVISTGASPAPPFFLAGAWLGLDLHYIESATRSQGPSLSGRLVAKLPSAHLYTQYPSWANRRWHYAGSIFDPYHAYSRGPIDTKINRIVVTFGTEYFGFRRAVEKLLTVLPRNAEILWQTGHTDVSGLGIKARVSVPSSELWSAIADADLVVSHAGTGSALTTFEYAKAPLLLPREAKYGEHVDDHQRLTATELSRRGLAVATRVEGLTADHLYRARSIRVIRQSAVSPFPLAPAEVRPWRSFVA